MEDPFTHSARPTPIGASVRLWATITLFIGTLFCTGFLVPILGRLSPISFDGFFHDQVSSVVFSLCLIGVYAAYLRHCGFRIHDFSNHDLNVSDYGTIFKIALLFIFVAPATTYAELMPIYFLSPEYLEYKLGNFPQVFFPVLDDAFVPLIQNTFSIISIVLLGPIAEELLFRGILLHRLSHIIGFNLAALSSSIVFAALHNTFLWPAIFGLVLCAVYTHFGSLNAAVVLHMANNAIWWLWEAIANRNGESYTPLEADVLVLGWPLAAVLAILSIVILINFFRSYPINDNLQPPQLV